MRRGGPGASPRINAAEHLACDAPASTSLRAGSGSAARRRKHDRPVPLCPLQVAVSLLMQLHAANPADGDAVDASHEGLVTLLRTDAYLGAPRKAVARGMYCLSGRCDRKGRLNEARATGTGTHASAVFPVVRDGNEF
jgi:hypothetical protein